MPQPSHSACGEIDTHYIDPLCIRMHGSLFVYEHFPSSFPYFTRAAQVHVWQGGLEMSRSTACLNTSEHVSSMCVFGHTSSELQGGGEPFLQTSPLGPPGCLSVKVTCDSH